MEKIKKYNIEGTLLEIPLRYDEKSGRYMEEYPDFVKEPVYTPGGCPIMLTLEDACAFGERSETSGKLVDCGSCRFYRQFPGTFIGVCGNDKKRKV